MKQKPNGLDSALIDAANFIAKEGSGPEFDDYEEDLKNEVVYIYNKDNLVGILPKSAWDLLKDVALKKEKNE
jgi:hypothetical protein